MACGPVGVIATIGHEFKHVYQHQLDSQVESAKDSDEMALIRERYHIKAIQLEPATETKNVYDFVLGMPRERWGYEAEAILSVLLENSKIFHPQGKGILVGLNPKDMGGDLRKAIGILAEEKIERTLRELAGEDLDVDAKLVAIQKLHELYDDAANPNTLATSLHTAYPDLLKSAYVDRNQSSILLDIAACNATTFFNLNFKGHGFKPNLSPTQVFYVIDRSLHSARASPY